MSRLTLILLITVFVGPFVLAVLLLNTDGDLLPAHTAEHGVLYRPPVEMPDLVISRDPASGETSGLWGKWSMIQVDPGSCDDACRSSLVATRQVRLALGKDMQRIQRLLIVTHGMPDPALVQEHPGLIIYDVQRENGLKLVQAIGPAAPGDIFIVDPLGNLMMRYPVDTPMKGMYEDLKRLLKLSQIG